MPLVVFSCGVGPTIRWTRAAVACFVPKLGAAEGALIRAAASTQTFGSFQLMEIKKLNRGDSFILNWSPMLLVPSLVGLMLSLWRGPVFMRYLIACAGLGLLFGTLVVLDYWKKRPTLSILGVLILIYGENLARSAFIGDVADGLGWVVVSQYLSLLLLSVFGLSWLFRQKILKRYE